MALSDNDWAKELLRLFNPGTGVELSVNQGHRTFSFDVYGREPIDIGTE